MKISKGTRVSQILVEYGSISEVIALFSVQRSGLTPLRALAAQELTVESAARIQQQPLEEFLTILNQAIRKNRQV